MSVNISLTRYLDFVVKSGIPRITSVRTTKEQAASKYDPRKDFYKTFREAVVELHKGNGARSDLDAMLGALTDDKKVSNYPVLVAGYKRFFKQRSQWAWFQPPRAVYDCEAAVTIAVNPELGLEIDDTPMVIKLHFKDDRPKKHELTIINHLMRTSLEDSSSPERVFAVLDVRRGKLFVEGEYDPVVMSLVDGEMLAFSAIWQGI